MELEDFLVEAKRLTYGSAETKPTLLDDGSKEYRVEIDEYLYRDRYFGGNLFIGEEVVYHHGKPIWFMNYYGKATQREPDEVFGFLVKALGKVERNKPFRGPENYQEDLWQYRFMSRGGLFSFWGEEKILYDGIRVYWLRFHGERSGVTHKTLEMNTGI